MSLGHVTLNCAREGCFAIITVHPTEEDRLRTTHETFYCPSGHSNYFPGATPAEKETNRLRSKVSRLRGLIWSFYSAATVCPLGCGWQSRRWIRGDVDDFTYGSVRRYLERCGWSVSEHLIREHGASPTTRKQIPQRTGDAR